MIQTTYYSVKGITEIAKLAIEYRKVLAIDKLIAEIERQKLISESIQAYSLLIKNDIQSLMHMYFKSAYENLHYALTASGKNKDEYLRQAKARFIDATTVEKNENLILSYIGLAFCQAYTKDTENSTITLNKIKGVSCVLPNDSKELESIFLTMYEKDVKVVCILLAEIVTGLKKKHIYSEYHLHKGLLDDNELDVCLNAVYNNTLDEIKKNYLYHDFAHAPNPAPKEYYKHFFKLFRSPYGRYIFVNENGKDGLNYQAIKDILQEKFELFKSAIVSQFGIQ